MQKTDTTDTAQKQMLSEARASMLKNGHRIRVKLGGYSMFPTLLPNDEAVVIPLNGSLPRSGDIVLIELPEKWIAHRIVQIRTIENITQWVTQGDSVIRPDQILHTEMIAGRVDEVFRGKRALKLYQGWRGLLGWTMVSLRPLPQIGCRLLLKVTGSDRSSLTERNDEL